MDPFLKEKKSWALALVTTTKINQFYFFCSSRGKFDCSKKGTEPKLGFIYFCPIWIFINTKRNSDWAKKRPSLGLAPNLELGPSFAFFCFCPIQVSLGTKRSSDGANVICQAWARLQIQSLAQSRCFFSSSELLSMLIKALMELIKTRSRAQLFFSSWRTFCSAERSLEGA